MTGPVRLRTALTPALHQLDLLDGTARIPGVELDIQDVHPHPEIFRRMGRGDEFDLCELSVMTYLIGRDMGRAWTALPVVPRHMFHHATLQVNLDAGISSPADLAGRRVGTRNWTVTPGVHGRGILSDDFGLDLDAVTWVLAEDEHIPASADRYPPNVVPGDSGDLFDRMVSGEIPAGIAGANARRRTSPVLGPLFPDATGLDRARYARTGIVPPFTVVVVHDRVLADRPWLLEALWDAFSGARKRGLEAGPGVAAVVDGDPVPFGLDANRAGFQELLRLGREQHMLTGSDEVDDLFAAFD